MTSLQLLLPARSRFLLVPLHAHFGVGAAVARVRVQRAVRSTKQRGGKGGGEGSAATGASLKENKKEEEFPWRSKLDERVESPEGPRRHDEPLEPPAAEVGHHGEHEVGKVVAVAHLQPRVADARRQKTDTTATPER